MRIQAAIETIRGDSTEEEKSQAIIILADYAKPRDFLDAITGICPSSLADSNIRSLAYAFRVCSRSATSDFCHERSLLPESHAFRIGASGTAGYLLGFTLIELFHDSCQKFAEDSMRIFGHASTLSYAGSSFIVMASMGALFAGFGVVDYLIGKTSIAFHRFTIPNIVKRMLDTDFFVEPEIREILESSSRDFGYRFMSGRLEKE